MTCDDGLAEPFAAFVAALLAPEQPLPAGLMADGHLQRRFAIHRTGVRRVWREGLAAQFPVTRRLVGDDFLMAAADLFAEACPPLSPVVAEAGAGFPAFLAGFPPLGEMPVVADVARLEWAMVEAGGAAEATPLPLAALAGVDPARLAGARLALHPSLRLLTTPTPARSVWLAHQEADPPAAVADWQAEHTLVLRPEAALQLAALGSGESVFIAALAEGAAIEQAAAEAADDPGFAPGQALMDLFRGGAVVALRMD